MKALPPAALLFVLVLAGNLWTWTPCPRIIGAWESTQISSDGTRETYRFIETAKSIGRFTHQRIDKDGRALPGSNEGTYKIDCDCRVGYCSRPTLAIHRDDANGAGTTRVYVKDLEDGRIQLQTFGTNQVVSYRRLKRKLI